MRLTADEVAHLPHRALLGAGATAEVYLSEYPSTGAIGEPGQQPALALKVARDGLNAVLLREARALVLTQGPGVPRLFGLGRQGSQVCLALEQVEGLPLDRYLCELEGLGPSEALEHKVSLAGALLELVGGALLRLHDVGWAHCDVKPENIMVGPWEPHSGRPSRVVLLDFGLASDDHTVRSGTPLYLPQTTLRGAQLDTLGGDTYALCRTVAGIFDRRWHELRDVPQAWAGIPSQFREILEPILTSQELLLPKVDWLWNRALDLGLIQPTEHSLLTLRQQYVATRFVELSGLSAPYSIQLDGLPAVWCDEVCGVFGLAAALERSERLTGTTPLPHLIKDLSLHDRGRFLGRVLGPMASSWDLPQVSDGVLVDGLAQLARHSSLRGITMRRLAEALRAGQQAPTEDSDTSLDPCVLALALGERPVSTATLLKVDALLEAPLALLEEAARVARLSGELLLAGRLVERCDSDVGRLERALLLSRQGRRNEAEAILIELEGNAASHLRARAAAQLARFALDRGQLVAAKDLVARAGANAARCEVEALLLLTSGDFPACSQTLELGLGLAQNAEEKSRLFGVRGMLEHSQGRAPEALASFTRAVEFARLAGAALEEATYLTGVAAAASDAADLALALDASERAERLFEALGKHEATARSLLARASVLAVLGARTELRTVVDRGLTLAARGGDARCEAFLLLCACDAEGDREERSKLARRAFELLKDSDQDARLNAAARLFEATGEVAQEADEWARTSEQLEARIQWWKARASTLTSKLQPELTPDALFVLAQLENLAQAPGHPTSLGPALASGAHLALRVGRAETARLFLHRADDVARHLLSHVRDEHLASASALSWVEQAQGSRIAPEDRAGQLSDVEGLLKALGRRQGFRSLLDQVLDMLLLWTGVERGLLLLNAPGGRLVVRAARNLNKADLTGGQQQLSLSIAKRAVDEGRPIALVDAAADASDLQRSVLALNLRSVLAVPLCARGEILGVAYLDDRVRRGAFGHKEISWANLIATVAALAIWDEKDRLSLRRALRRAQRAEQKVGDQLSKNELQLELAERELGRLRDDRQLRFGYEKIIGRSRAIRDLLQLVDRVAQSDVPAMIVGESGTGKELVARAIAEVGPRKGKPFVAENCGAIPESLLESTLFGHRKGAFTGATRHQAGLFSLAHGGTLLLDEVGEMPLVMQTKLLRVLQDGEVRALGAERPIKVDVRLIVATHRDLSQMVAEGKFRQDLYFRLNVVRLPVPALRERPEDIPLLVTHFLAEHSKPPCTISDAALARLCAFSWPGNVRQLENEVRRMIVLGGQHLTAADLSPELLASPVELQGPGLTLRQKMDALERRLVLEALEQSGGNRTRAAEALGVSRFGLQKMTQRLDIEIDSALQKSGRILARGLDERS